MKKKFLPFQNKLFGPLINFDCGVVVERIAKERRGTVRLSTFRIVYSTFQMDRLDPICAVTLEG